MPIHPTTATTTDDSFSHAVRLLKRRSARAAGRHNPPAAARIVPAEGGGGVAALEQWASTSVHLPWFEGAEYQFRLGSHHLILANGGLSARHEAAVGTAEVEIAMVVEGPLIVLGARFGDHPWVWASPFNWHFAPPAERIVPARVPLTGESYFRLWGRLWITLVDSNGGTPLGRRAAALRPEFTRALHAELDRQATRPFPVKAADKALDRLNFAAESLESRIRTRSRSAAVTDRGGGFTARTTPPYVTRNLLLGTDRWLTT